MTKEKKLWNLVEDEIKIIECIKEYLNEYSLKSNLIKRFTFQDETFDSSIRIVAILDCGSFEQRIVYYPKMLPKEHFIDVEFSFKNSDYLYNFYDIFNLFDIDDFEMYCYESLLTVDEVENALKEILSATEEYFYYIEKAQTEEYLPQLEKNYEADMSAAYGSDGWKQEEDKDWLALMNHPINTLTDGSITPEMIKELRELDDDLTTIYGKRLLKHLEREPNFTRKMLFDKEAFEKLYKKALLKIWGLILLISVVAVFALAFLVRAVMLKSGVILESQVRISFCLVAAVMYAMAIMIAFGENLLVKSMPEEYRKRARAKFERNQAAQSNSNKKPSKALTVALSAIVFLLATFSFALNFLDVRY